MLVTDITNLSAGLKQNKLKNLQEFKLELE